MKLVVSFACLLLAAASAFAAEWGTDYPNALEQARQEKKVVLLDFTGSDWCAGCMQLKKDVFSTKEFEAFAKENLVLVEVDFPIKKKISEEQKAANQKLEEQFAVEGYPTVVLVDPSGKKLGMEEGYLGNGPKAYIKRLEEILAKGKGK